MSDQYQPQHRPQPYPFQPIPGALPMYYPPQPPVVKPGRGLAITSLVLGIIGVLFGLIPLTFWMALVLGVLALVFGLVGRRHGMGKAGAILAVAAIALGIAGAVIVNRAVDKVTNDLNSISLPTATTPVDAPVDPDDAFITVIRQDGLFPTADDADLVDIGQKACSALDTGNSYLTVVNITMTSGDLTAYDAGYFVGAAIAAYCPQDAYLVPGQ